MMLPFFTVQAQMARLYTTENGLPNSQVNHIYQDSRGFVWISTENGLARFDGRDFRSFRFNRGKEGSLASDLVISTFEDSCGTIWVGTSTGLQAFDPEDLSFHLADLKDPEYPSSTQHISCIEEIKTGPGGGELWIATSQHGVYVMDPKSRGLKEDRRARLSTNLPSAFIYTIYQDSKGLVWLAGETGGLAAVDAATLEKKPLPFDTAISVRDFEEDPSTGNILIATMSGLYIYDRAKDVIRASKDPAARTCQACSLLYNRTMRRVGDRTFIVGTESTGLKVYDMQADILRLPNLPPVSHDMSRWKVHSLMHDKQENIWIGAFQTGVMVIPHSMYGFEYIRTDYGIISSIARNPNDGSLWVGSDGGGLMRIDRDGTRRVFNSSNSALTNNSVLSLAFDGSGRLWIATYLDGLFTYTPAGGFRRFADGERIGTPNIACLTYDSVNDLIYAGTYGAGMSIISPAQDKVVQTVAEDMNKWVSTIYIDRGGTVWVGTYNGPMCYNHSMGKLFSYNLGDAAIKSRVYCFQEDAKGQLWIGTGEGVTVCDRTRGVVNVISEADGLSNNVVEAILEADDGAMWISTSYGLNHLDPKTSAITNYYAYDGLQGNEFHAGAAHKDSDGQLFFGGTGGITNFLPQIVNQEAHPVPPLYFSRLTVLNEEVNYDAAAEDNILDKHITEATRITLPNKKNTFTLEFSVLEYTNPMKIRYACRLDHFDKAWRHLPFRSNTVSYTNLPAGRYTLHVKAYFDGSMDQCSTADIDIRVEYPWYLSGLAFFVYIILLLAIAWVLLFLMKRHREHVRDKEMSEIKELKLKMFTNISHEIRTPLTLLMSPLKQMRESETEPRKKDLYNLMYRNSLRILRMVNQIMDMRKVDEGKMQLHFLETDIVGFIKDIMQSFDNLATTRGISLTLNAPAEGVSLWVDQGNFDKIIFNLLSNAFKHTPDGGKVEILIDKQYQDVKISVTNSGSHIDAPDLDKVFDRFFQSDVMDAKMGSGVGLSLTRELVDLHHGTIAAANTIDGVCFTVSLPRGKAHLSEEELSKTSHHKDLYFSTESVDDIVKSTEDLAFTPKAEDSDHMVKSRRSVFIVDDDSEIRDYLLSELKPIYNVRTFAGAQEAWAEISTHQPDVVVSDLMMAGMDGLELCRKIRHNPVTNHIPVIILTSSADERSHLESIDSGADRFLSKPLSIDLLRSSIAQVLSARDTLRGKFSREDKYDYEEVKIASATGQLSDRVMDVVKQNLDNPDFGVEDLSREVGMSRVHLNRKLKEMMGISPSSLIKSTRMKQAAYLMVHDKVNISEVAYRVGFSTPSYFSNSFRSYFGMAPKEFIAKFSDPTNSEELKKLFE